jgi:3-dehydroquinate synthase
MRKIRVKIDGGRGYDILVGFGILPRIGRHIRRVGVRGSVFLITSPAIGRHYLNPLLKGLRAGGCKDIRVNHVPDGEKHKNVAWAEKLLRKLGQFAGSDKDVFVVNLGGGVIGDMGGFVAATYRRGIAYIQVPTTLLAFVDCGIGGKVGVNLDGAKNLVGSFHQPRLVCADLALLDTLAKRELRSALAEVVKYGVIQDHRFFEYVEGNIDKVFSLDRSVIEYIAVKCYTMKADIVRQDEFDRKGIRMRLNFGHTIGHAIESASNYAYRHGEAVSIGMVCANDISVKLGLMEKSVAARIENVLIKIGLPVKAKNHNLDRIMKFLRLDKKSINGKNRFVLATGIGKTRIKENIPERVIRDVIKNRFSFS